MAKKAAKKAAKPVETETKKPDEKTVEETVDETVEELVKVEAVKRLCEDGVVYKPGEVLEVTPERAKALGDLVKKTSGD